MDRELCVLIYSEFSPASKLVIDYIQSLPYDIAAITGMTMFAADTQDSRDKLLKLSIESVPCIFVRYFDGTTNVYESNGVYKFIDAISAAIQKQPIATPEHPHSLDIDLPRSETPPTTTPVKREDVMSACNGDAKGSRRAGKTRTATSPPTNSSRQIT